MTPCNERHWEARVTVQGSGKRAYGGAAQVALSRQLQRRQTIEERVKAARLPGAQQGWPESGAFSSLRQNGRPAVLARSIAPVSRGTVCRQPPILRQAQQGKHHFRSTLEKNRNCPLFSLRLVRYICPES